MFLEKKSYISGVDVKCSELCSSIIVVIADICFSPNVQKTNKVWQRWNVSAGFFFPA